MTTSFNHYHAFDFHCQLKPRFGYVELDPKPFLQADRQAMDGLFKLLRVRVGGQLVQDLADFERFHQAAWAQVSSEMEKGLVGEEVAIEARSPTSYLAKQLLDTQKDASYIWPDPESFFEYCEQLTAPQLDGISSLMESLTGNDCNEILGPKHPDWKTPLQIDELAGATRILGRLFVKQPDEKWLRADRYVRTYSVVELQMRESEGDENDDLPWNGTFESTRLLGTSGTLAGAIEIAELAVEALAPFQSSIPKPWTSPFPHRYRIIETATQQTVLNADVQTNIQRQSEGYLLTAHNEWERPPTPLETLNTEREIASLKAELAPGQSYTQHDRIKVHLAVLRESMLAPSHSYEFVSVTLKETLSFLGKDRALSALFETDLGL